MAVHVRFEFLYISLPSSAKQQREMTTSFMYFGEREPELNAVGAYLAWANF